MFLAYHVSTLWRLVSCLDAVMWFFFTMESILRSSTTADLNRGLFMFTGASFFSDLATSYVPTLSNKFGFFVHAKFGSIHLK